MKQNVVPKCSIVLKIVEQTPNVAVLALGTKLFVSTHAHVTPVGGHRHGLKWHEPFESAGKFLCCFIPVRASLVRTWTSIANISSLIMAYRALASKIQNTTFPWAIDEISEEFLLFSDCILGCKQCSNPICKPKLALVLYNLGVFQPQFKPMLFDFQGISLKKVAIKMTWNLRPRNQFQFWSREECYGWANIMWCLVQGRVLHYRRLIELLYEFRIFKEGENSYPVL